MKEFQIIAIHGDSTFLQGKFGIVGRREHIGDIVLVLCLQRRGCETYKWERVVVV